MSEVKLVAEVRESFGKGAARKLRAAGRTPAVIYGHGHDTRHIHLSAHEVALALRIKNALLELSIGGKSELVLVKSASKDPFTQIIEHVDLVEVKKGEKVHVQIPVHIIGETLGGTVLDFEHKSVKGEAEATHIPEFVELHISKENPAGHHYLELAHDELIASVVETRAGVADDESAAGATAEGEATEAASSDTAE